jgi:magnesium chelatase family protein
MTRKYIDRAVTALWRYPLELLAATRALISIIRAYWHLALLMFTQLCPQEAISCLWHLGSPCPCGFWNDPTRECRCTPLQIQRYVGRISGPLLDRIDIHIDVPAVKFRDLTGETPPETDDSGTIRARVIEARERQRTRLTNEKIFSNAEMTPRMIRRHCRIDSESEQMLERAMTRLGLSARAYDRILKVSRTIADLESSDEIRSAHVAEAVGYRSLDRTYWT